MEDHGFKSMGKYSSARDSILSFLCVDGWANESTGNVEAPTGFFSRISNEPADVQQENTEFTSIMEQWLEQNPEVTDSPELRSELVGHYIVQSMDSGFVYVYKYETEREMLGAYNDMEREYFLWDGQSDD